MQRAVADENALVYAFGERWGPETGEKDKYFGFLPGNGIHDIHMNQGNSGRFVGDDGVYQDGGLLVHFPDQHEWVGDLPEVPVAGLAHRRQDRAHDRRRRRLPAPIPRAPTPPPPPTADRRRAARPGPHRRGAGQRGAIAGGRDGHAAQHRAARRSISRAGRCSTPRRSACRSPARSRAGARAWSTIQQPLALSNKGGVITLIDDKGLKVHGVSYTKEQARNPGWTLVF